MSKKSESAEQHIKSVKRRTRRKYSAKTEMDYEHLKAWLDENTRDRGATHSVPELAAPSPRVTRTNETYWQDKATAGSEPTDLERVKPRGPDRVEPADH